MQLFQSSKLLNNIEATRVRPLSCYIAVIGNEMSDKILKLIATFIRINFATKLVFRNIYKRDLHLRWLTYSILYIE